MQIRPLLTLVSALAIAGAGARAAQPAETLEMADGSVFMGHTSRLDYRDGSFQFRYDSATVVLPRNEVESLTRKESTIERLPDAWKRWFAIRTEYVRTDADGNRIVTLHNLTDTHGKSATVFLYERGPRFVKYQTVDIGTVTLSDSDVKVYKYGSRDDLDLTGIVTEILTTDGRSVRGQLVQESAEGKGILTDDFVIELVPSELIASMRRMPLDPDCGIESQVEYLDQIEVDASANERTGYKGILTEMNYGDEVPYVLIFDPNHPEDQGTKVAVEKLVSRSKAPNPFYSPQRDALVMGSNVVVADVSLSPATFEVSKNGELYTADAEKVQPVEVTPKKGETVIWMRDTPANSDMVLVRVEKQKQGKKYVYKLNRPDLAENAIEGVRKVSRRGIARLIFTHLPDGTYILFNRNTQQIYPFRIGDDIPAVG